MSGLRARSRAVVLLLMVAGCVVGISAAADPARADDVTITWPDSSKINPETMTYEVLTAGTNPATDYFWVVGSPSSKTTYVEADGSTTVDLPTGEGAAWVYLYRCDNGCTLLAPARRLELRSELIPSDNHPLTSYVGPSSREKQISFEPAEVTTVDVSWAFFASPSDESSTPVLSGHIEDAPVPFTMPRLNPDDLVQWQQYDLRISYAADTPWGRLQAVREQPGIHWDSGIDVSVQQNLHTIYPVRDDYRDYLILTATWQEEYVRSMDLMVRNESGEVVYEEEDDGYPRYSPRRLWWEPRSIPEGTYTATIDVEDWAGNTQQIDREVEVVNKELRLVEWSETYRADDVMVDRGVGRCGSLKRPARAAWRGSIGYRTAASCRRSQQWYASTVHGVYVPYSFTDKYLVKVSAFGGKPKADKRSYLKMFYRNREDDDWIDGGYFGDRVGLHDGYEKRRSIVLGQGDKKPYVLWSVGLAGGYNYDVKSFTIVVNYETLTY